MRLIVTDEAVDDLRRARAWYESQARTAGDQLAVAVARAIDKIVDRPNAYPEIEPGVRRILCEKFPYKVIYTIEAGTLFVLGIYTRRATHLVGGNMTETALTSSILSPRQSPL